MKLRTHYVFSLGLLFLVDSLIVDSPFYLLILTGIISIVANNVIDFLGHEIKGKYISRTPRTHTLPRSIGWGLLVTLPIAVILYYFYPESEAIPQHLRHPYVASNNIRPFLLTPCLFCSHSYFTFKFFNFD